MIYGIGTDLVNCERVEILLIKFGEKNLLKLNNINGIKFDIFLNEWKLSNDKSVNYISEFVKI